MNECHQQAIRHWTVAQQIVYCLQYYELKAITGKAYEERMEIL